MASGRTFTLALMLLCSAAPVAAADPAYDVVIRGRTEAARSVITRNSSPDIPPWSAATSVRCRLGTSSSSASIRQP